MTWQVTVSLDADATRIEGYHERLEKQLRRICPDYQPSVRPCEVTLCQVIAGSEQVARGKSLYWLRRAVQRDRTLRWNNSLVRSVECRTA